MCPLVYVSLGSNISPRKDYLIQSLHLIKEQFPVRFSVSSLYETKPYGNLKHQSYYNCCACFESSLSTFKTLALLLGIEKKVGRVRSGVKWESRCIDIDIVLWEDKIVQQKELMIPHYDISNRDFFIIPLLEMDKELINPKSGESLRSELSKIPVESRTHPVRIVSPFLL